MSTVAVEEEKLKKKNDPDKTVVNKGAETVQRDLADVNGPEGGMLPRNVSARIQSKRGSGQRLSDRNLQKYSQKFGRDMSDVHVHTDTESDTISRSLNARAFTIGSDVFLTKGINPEAGGGRDAQTMTHELTHVVQQNGHAGMGALKLGAADTAQEHEAQNVAQREYDSKLKEEDTIQRDFLNEVGSAIRTPAMKKDGAKGGKTALNNQNEQKPHPARRVVRQNSMSNPQSNRNSNRRRLNREGH